MSFIIASLLLAGAAYAAYQLWRQMQAQANGAQGHGDSAGKGNTPPPPPVKRENPIAGREDLINRVVAGVKFASTRVVVAQRHIGTERRPSIVPADDVDIRPIRGFGEMPHLLPATQVLDDATFYARLAAHQLPVAENIENIELTEPEYGPPRKALIWIQDISGSMAENSRINWSLRLGERLIDKCLDEKAEIVLIAYNRVPHPAKVAKTEAEAHNLKENLGTYLIPGGDTETVLALRAGIDYVRKNSIHEARIVLVTDGHDDISTEIGQKLKNENIVLHTICIAGDNPALRNISQQYDILRDPPGSPF